MVSPSSIGRRGVRLPVLMLVFFIILNSFWPMGVSAIQEAPSGSDAARFVNTDLVAAPAALADPVTLPASDVVVDPTTAPDATTSDPAPAALTDPDPTTTPDADTQDSPTVTPDVVSDAPLSQPPFNPENQKSLNPLSVEQNLQTGALTASYAITAPPGRNGLNPGLQLNYNSQDENIATILGHGWSFNIPSIERLPKKGVDRLYSENYFSSSLSGELKPVNLIDATHGEYGAEVESGEFLKYEFTVDGAWVVKDKKGLTYTFGLTAQSRQDNPSDPSKVFKWMLEEVRDSNGNTITYQYYKYQMQIHPQKITYGGTSTEPGIYQINFSTINRTLPVSYSTGFLVRNSQAINEIVVSVNGQWTRKYGITYAKGDNDAEDMMTNITESVRAEDGTEMTLPTTEFQYSTAGKTWQKTANKWPLNNGNLILLSEYNGLSIYIDMGLRLFDINGDALPDFMRSLNSPTEEGGLKNYGEVQMNRGEAWAAWSLDQNYQLPVGFVMTDNASTLEKGVRIADVNGDGLADIVKSYGNVNDKEPDGVYLNKGDGTGWQRNTTYTFPSNFTRYIINGGSFDSGCRLFDVNGDGLPDITCAVTSYDEMENSGQVYLNDGTRWVETPGYIFPVGFIKQAGIPGHTESRGVQIADVNGDGLADLVKGFGGGLINNNGVYLNKGDGTGWVRASSFMLPGDFEFDNHLSGVVNSGCELFDANGDNLPDVVCAYTSYNEVENSGVVFINTGTTWTQDYAYTVPVGFVKQNGQFPASYGVNISDVNGDGLNDLVKSFQGSTNNGTYLKQGGKPGLLTKITSSLGGQTTVVYKPSTAYRKPDYQNPDDTLANPKLSTVIQTVSAITTDDGFGNTATTSYDYAGGQYFYAGPFDRKFAGFAKVTSTDPDGNKTSQYFHQGNASNSTQGEYQDQKAKINLVYREEILGTSGNLYQTTINKWDGADLGNGRTFVFKAQTIQQDYDGNSTHRDRAQSFTYDPATGNLLEAKNWGEVNAADDGTFSDISGDSTLMTYAYATNPANPVMSLPSQEILNDNNGNKKAETRYAYDGLVFGSADKGNLTKQENWILGAVYAVTQHAYDAYGLLTSDTDPRGSVTTYGYDNVNLYPTTATNALNQIIAYTYDYSSGKPLAITDPNGHTVSYTYDAADRLLTESQPDWA
ncbi:VCBS repeat-containing protein, partial [Candidatus Falkowbacteria bacterium]|nr:VCBS repeat-containing protein [Candidatus Falkowbacteria bacterium]